MIDERRNVIALPLSALIWICGGGVLSILITHATFDLIFGEISMIVLLIFATWLRRKGWL